jgi:stearoyl-CoA desaturase (delta-9 desaturase)
MPWATLLYSIIIGYFLGFSLTAGAHRLWAHKSYEAKLPLKILMMLGFTITGQNCIYIWSRDHRVHHKFSDTDADPHNTKRGYFFAHVGWLMRKKHPELKLKAKTLDFSDLENDPIVRVQRDYYWLFYLVFTVFIPIAIPVYFWNELWLYSFYAYVGRYVSTLHMTWFVNSTAHMFGAKPYNKHISPVENHWVSFGGIGEGYHNYHHTFPWDYRASEDHHCLNITRNFIDRMAQIGQVYNLKTASNELIEKVRLNMANEGKHGHSHIEIDYDAVKPFTA